MENQRQVTEKREIQGVFEHKRQPGVWCIDYYDREGRRHREKIGKASEQIGSRHGFSD